MIAMVTRAEARLPRAAATCSRRRRCRRRWPPRPKSRPSSAAPARCGRARRRGAQALRARLPRRPRVLNYVNGADVADYSQRGVVTPDHIIRTKNYAAAACRRRRRASSTCSARPRAAVADYAARYDAMFRAQNARVGGSKTKLDPMPRVVLVPGVGLFGVGATAKDAAIAADLAENAVKCHHRCRGDRPLRAVCRRRTCSM